jgi:hypothetical protein
LLLRDSLGGNSKTIMMAAISPSALNYEETLSTLQYASRAKLIKNRVKINTKNNDAMIGVLRNELEQLKNIISLFDNNCNGNNNNNDNSKSNPNPNTDENLQEEFVRVRELSTLQFKQLDFENELKKQQEQVSRIKQGIYSIK